MACTQAAQRVHGSQKGINVIGQIACPAVLVALSAHIDQTLLATVITVIYI